MKTILMPEPGEVIITDIEMPVRKKGEALLKLIYGGICGSDLGSYRGANVYVVYPCIPGHEFAAEIIEIDANDQGLKPGMIVTCNPYFNCGHCYSCRRGRVNVCEDNRTMGVQRQGAFSQYITMPIERIYDGKGLSPRTLALIEPFCISYHGVSRVGIREGDKVLVLGAGTIGVLAAVSAKDKGGEVTICDIAPGKLDFACSAFGIHHKLLNSSPEAFAAGVEEFTDGNGYDVTIEAVGSPQTFQNCIDAVCFGGRMLQIGVSKKSADNFFFVDIQKKELNIFGSRGALKKDFLELIDKVKNGDVELQKIVTDEYAWTDAPRAFAEFDQNSDEMLKVILNFTV